MTILIDCKVNENVINWLHNELFEYSLPTIITNNQMKFGVQCGKATKFGRLFVKHLNFIESIYCIEMHLCFVFYMFVVIDRALYSSMIIYD